MSTHGLPVHLKVFQQAGVINMARSHLPSPERILREGKPVRVLVKPDDQASKKDRSLERISLLPHLKLNASTNSAFCKITGSVQHLQATNRNLAPTTSTSTIVFVVLETHLVSPPIGQSGGQPLFLIPHLRLDDKTWQRIGWNWSDSSKQFCKI